MKFFNRALTAFLIVCFTLLSLYWGVERSFDLESYASEIKKSLKDSYDVDVAYAKLRYRITTNLKIIAEEVSISGDDISANIDKVEFSLPIFSLIMGNVVIADVDIYNPQIPIKRFKDGSFNLGAYLVGAAGVEGGYSAPVRRLSIVGGEISFTDEFFSFEPTSTTITISSLSFNTAGVVAPATIKFSGHIDGEEDVSEVKLSLFWKRGSGRDIWKDLRLGGKLNIGTLEAKALEPFIGDAGLLFDKEERILASFQFDGDLSKSLIFSGDFSVIKGKYGGNKQSKRFEVNGTFSQNKILLDNVVLRLPELTLNGKAEISDVWEEDPYLKIEVDAPFLNVSLLESGIPSILGFDHIARFLTENIQGGLFKVADLRLEGLYSSFFKIDDPEEMALITGKVEVRDFILNLEGFKRPITDINGYVQIDRDGLVFDGITAKQGETILKNISGIIEDYRVDPMLTVQVAADLDLKEFHEELLSQIVATDLRNIFEPVKSADGSLGFDLHITADLNNEELNDIYGELYFRGVGFKHDLFDLPIRELTGKAYVDQSQIAVEKMEWITGSTNFKTKGKIENFRKADYSIDFTFDADGEIKEFAHTYFYSFPVLKKLKGKVVSNLSLKGNLEDIYFSHTANLSEAEFSFGDYFLKPRKVNAIQEVQGNLKNRKELKIDLINMEIGSSSFSMTGEVFGLPEFKDYDITMNLKKLRFEDIPSLVTVVDKGDYIGTIEGTINITDRPEKEKAYIDITADIKKLKLDPLAEFGSFMEFLQAKGDIWGNFNVKGGSDRQLVLNGVVEGKGVGFNTLLAKPFSELEGKAELMGDKVRAKGIPGKMGDSHGMVTLAVDLKKIPEVILEIEGDEVHLSDVVNIANPGEGKDTAPSADGAPESYSEQDDSAHAKWKVIIKSNKGTLEDLKYSKLDTEFDFFRGIYEFSHLKFDAYGGHWEATNGKLDTVRADDQIFNTDVKVEGFDLTGFLTDVIPNFNKMTGTMDFSGNIKGNGLSWERFSKTLGGKLDVMVKDGMVHKFDGLSQLFSYLNVVPLFEKRKEKQTGEGVPFDTITGLLDFKDGVGHTENMKLEGSVIRVSAVGDIDLGEQNLDLVMGVMPFTSIDSIVSRIPIAGEILTGEKKGIVSTYYNVKGPFEDPSGESLPGESIARGILGIFQRIFEAPARALSTSEPDSK